MTNKTTFESIIRQIVREEVGAALTARDEAVPPATSEGNTRPVALSPAQVTARTGIAEQTLSNWRSMNRQGHVIGPPSFKLGRLIRYDPAELDAWLASHRTGKR